MPVSDLLKLREKYPQYNDLPNAVLAEKILAKYPQYTDLFGDLVGGGEIKAEKGFGGRVLERAGVPTTLKGWKEHYIRGPLGALYAATGLPALGEGIDTASPAVGIRRPVGGAITPGGAPQFSLGDIGEQAVGALGIPTVMASRLVSPLLRRLFLRPPPPAPAPQLALPGRPPMEALPGRPAVPALEQGAIPMGPTAPRAQGPLYTPPRRPQADAERLANARAAGYGPRPSGPPGRPVEVPGGALEGELLDAQGRPIPRGDVPPLSARDKARSLYKGRLQRRTDLVGPGDTGRPFGVPEPWTAPDPGPPSPVKRPFAGDPTLVDPNAPAPPPQMPPWFDPSRRPPPRQSLYPLQSERDRLRAQNRTPIGAEPRTTPEPPPPPPLPPWFDPKRMPPKRPAAREIPESREGLGRLFGIEMDEGAKPPSPPASAPGEADLLASARARRAAAEARADARWRELEEAWNEGGAPEGGRRPLPQDNARADAAWSAARAEATRADAEVRKLERAAGRQGKPKPEAPKPPDAGPEGAPPAVPPVAGRKAETSDPNLQARLDRAWSRYDAAVAAGDDFERMRWGEEIDVVWQKIDDAKRWAEAEKFNEAQRAARKKPPTPQVPGVSPDAPLPPPTVPARPPSDVQPPPPAAPLPPGMPKAPPKPGAPSASGRPVIPESKVGEVFGVEMEGKPPEKVYYHGTSHTFGEHDLAQANQEGAYGPGHYFSSDPAIANRYAAHGDVGAVRGDAPQVRPAHLDIKRPFNVGSPPAADVIALLPRKSQFDHLYPTNQGAYESLVRHLGSPAAANRALRDLGYDAIVHMDEVVVFDPKQIRSPWGAPPVSTAPKPPTPQVPTVRPDEPLPPPTAPVRPPSPVKPPEPGAPSVGGPRFNPEGQAQIGGTPDPSMPKGSLKPPVAQGERSLADFEGAVERAQKALREMGRQPPKPDEARSLGALGRDRAPKALVDKYDAELRRHTEWQRRYDLLLRQRRSAEGALKEAKTQQGIFGPSKAAREAEVEAGQGKLGAPAAPEGLPRVDVGDAVNTPQGTGEVERIVGNLATVKLDKGGKKVAVKVGDLVASTEPRLDAAKSAGAAKKGLWGETGVPDLTDLNHVSALVSGYGKIKVGNDLAGELARVPAHFKSANGISLDRIAESLIADYPHLGGGDRAVVKDMLLDTLTRGERKPKALSELSDKGIAAAEAKYYENLATDLKVGPEGKEETTFIDTLKFFSDTWSDESGALKLSVFRGFGKGLGRVGDDLRALLAPASRGETAAKEAGIMRPNLAELARKTERAHAVLRKAELSFERLSAAEQLRYIDALEQGRVPRPGSTAATLRDLFEDRRKTVQELGTGKLDHWIEDYYPHLWKDPQAAADAFAQAYGRRPLGGSGAFLKQRTIPTVAEGVAKGLEPVTTNPVTATLLKLREMDKYVMAQHILDEMKQAGLARLVPYDGRAPAGWTRIHDKISRAPGGAGQYWAPEPAARLINNHLTPGMQGNALFDVYRGIGNFLNQAQLGFSAFHLGFVSYDVMQSQVALGLQALAAGRPIQAAKLLATAPAAPVTSIFKGSKMLREYYAPGSQGQEIGALVDALIQGGGRAKMDRFYGGDAIKNMRMAFARGQYGSSALKAIPAAMEALVKPVMEGYVPRAKLGVFADLARFELSKLGPTATRQDAVKVMARAWDSVENRLGQMTYDNLFWNRMLKDGLMASVRSVGWNLGTLRELGGGAHDVGVQFGRAVRGRGFEVTPRMAYTATLPFMTALIGGVYQYLATGKGPETLKDYFYPRTGRTRPDGIEDRVTLPTYMKDVFAYGRHPWTTVKHKLSPTLALLGEMLENESFYGAAIRNPDDPIVRQMRDLADHVIGAAEPFAMRTYGQQREAGIGPAEAAQGFVGITPAPAEVRRSPAQQAMIDRKVARQQLVKKRRADARHPGLMNQVEERLKAIYGE